MFPTDKFFIVRRRIHPYHRPFFFYSALQARSDLHCKRKTPRTFCSRGLNKLVYTMSTYPPGICSNDGVKSPRMLVLYATTTSPAEAINCPQSVCCFSDMLQVLVIVCLLSPGIQKCVFNGCFWRFSSNQRYIHSYISFKIGCQPFSAKKFSRNLIASSRVARPSFPLRSRICSLSYIGHHVPLKP